MIESDPEFEKFRKKISIYEIKNNPIEGKIKIRDGEKRKKEKPAEFLKHQAHYFLKCLSLRSFSQFKNYYREESERNLNRVYRLVEKEQRDATRSAILKSIDPMTYVFISDIDEILDCQTEECLKTMNKIVENRRSPTVLHIKSRLRMWDFNNLNPSRNLTKRLIRVKYIAESEFSFTTLRSIRTGYVVSSTKELIHEYTSCQPFQFLLDKYNWYPDLKISENDLRMALKLNSEVIHDGEPQAWAEILEIEKDHQPKWVSENFNRISTGNVNPDYWESRREYLPELFPL